jgi:hypothetical protein
MAVAVLWVQRGAEGKDQSRAKGGGGDGVGSDKKSGTAGVLVRIEFFPRDEART